MKRLNHHTIDNGYVEVQLSAFLFESNSEYVTYPDTTSIRSIDDDAIDHLLEFFHTEHDDDILDVYIQMLQA